MIPTVLIMSIAGVCRAENNFIFVDQVFDVFFYFYRDYFCYYPCDDKKHAIVVLKMGAFFLNLNDYLTLLHPEKDIGLSGLRDMWK